MAGKHLLVGYGSSIQFNIVAQGIPYSDPSPQLPLVSAAERGNYRLRPARNSSVTRHEDALSLLSRLPPRQCLPLRRVRCSLLLNAAVAVACFLMIGLMESLITIAWPLFRGTCVLLEVSCGNAVWLLGCHPLLSAGRF